MNKYVDAVEHCYLKTKKVLYRIPVLRLGYKFHNNNKTNRFLSMVFFNSSLFTLFEKEKLTQKKGMLRK